MSAKLLVALIAAAFLGGIVLTTYLPQPTASSSGCNKPPGYILLVVDQTGFNDSMHHLEKNASAHWPVITVRAGQLVNIYVCDKDRVSAHGFAIDHYFDGGRAVLPGENYKISFLAKDAGTYTIYCNIFCPIHFWMLRGQLVVTPS